MTVILISSVIVGGMTRACGYVVHGEAAFCDQLVARGLAEPVEPEPDEPTLEPVEPELEPVEPELEPVEPVAAVVLTPRRTRHR